MIHGNLLQFLRSHGKTLAHPEQLDIIQQVASGMAYLAGINCVHRSLTSRSVLVGNELKCKIGSFTVAHMLDKDECEYKIPQGERVPTKWSAPEILLHSTCSTKSDVWSFGILQYEVMTCGVLKVPNTRVEDLVNLGDICDRLWEKGPLGSGDQFSVYCPIRKNSFCAFKCTLKHKKLIFLTEVIAF